jgi:Fe-S oxidoreductase
VAGLREILDRLGLDASFYGHAASGTLHVRPTLDLHSAEDVQRLRRVADEVSDLCKRFKGSLAAEHGVGIARTEYLLEHIGPELVEASRKIKALFDPDEVMNPGKIIDTGRHRVDADLRLGVGSDLGLPFQPVLGFVDRDRSFVGNLEQCNGCGGCLKDAPTMCPTFIATGEEIQSTRGRANTIRAALEGRFGEAGVLSVELEEALGNCLACKACRTECPSNVDLAQLKADLLWARHCRGTVPLRDRLIAASDALGRLGTSVPWLANPLISSSLVRGLNERAFGINADRPLPVYADERFDRWFGRRETISKSADRGPIILWDDTWVRYHEPEVGRAAVAVLEAAGFEIRLAEGRQCCGRPAFSRGLVREACRMGEHNLSLLAAGSSDLPIVFLEPSCWSMFVDEYRQLRLPHADKVAERCVLFEELVADSLRGDPGMLGLSGNGARVAIHDHCHAKALRGNEPLRRLADQIPLSRVEVLDTGCCGMAGAFGMLKEKDELSRRVAEPLVRLVDNQPPGTRIVASGISCRHQIRDLTEVRPVHMAELLAELLERSS